MKKEASRSNSNDSLCLARWGLTRHVFLLQLEYRHICTSKQHLIQASESNTLSMVSSKYSNTETVEYSTIMIIEFGFGENTLSEKNKNIRGVKRKSIGNPILLTKEIKNKSKKSSSVVEPLEKFPLFPSVSET